MTAKNNAKTALPPPRRNWTDRLRTSVPTREVLAAHPWLKPVAHRVLDPQLWSLRNEAVARGVAIGIFWAFAIPAGQFIAAAAHSVWWRANIPVAAGMTLITNPFTLGFWLWLAYKLGSFLLDAPPAMPRADHANLVAWLTSFGAPALLGMAIFAVGGAALGYMTVKLFGRLRIWFRRRNR
ncbi:MAG: DUF2062 domain-containing protein [Polaromonas sp.]|nr:DUF2062 domain-containing protein [Polaromonas sp.]